MNQTQLDRSVARATGESIATIRHLGFSEMLMPRPVFFRPKIHVNRRIPASKLLSSLRIGRSLVA